MIPDAYRERCRVVAVALDSIDPAPAALVGCITELHMPHGDMLRVAATLIALSSTMSPTRFGETNRAALEALGLCLIEMADEIARETADAIPADWP